VPRADRGPRGETDDRILVGRRPVLELLRAGANAEKILFAQGMAPNSTLGEIRKRADALAIPVKNVPRTELDKHANGENHQGVVAFAGRFRYSEFSDLLKAANPALLFLDGLTDPHNLGSLLRSADGAGFDGIVIPARRSVSVTPAVRRVAAGAAEIVRVARVGNLSQALDEARRAGVWIVGFDQDATEDLWTSTLLERPLGLVLGSEDKGLSQAVKDHCDGLVGIPSLGRLESLNVAVAGAIGMFEVARRGRSQPKSV
jgi:23S rRNA (guanosine2251-2'-O)-methyltransferase